jgi:hypothetical protein
MPGLNEILDAKSTVYGSGKSRQDAYNKLKEKWTTRIHADVLTVGTRPVVRARFLFTWYEPTRGRDPDNVAAGGRKLILDALKACGVIANDGWAQVAGWEDRFVVDKERPGVRIEIIPA